MPQGLIAENRRNSRIAASLLLPLIALSLGACGADRMATGSIQVSPDYQQTHPITLSEMPTSLDIFPGPGRMDRETDRRLKEFAAGFRANGVGQIEVLMPEGAYNHPANRAALPAIRASLAAGGASGNLSVGSYAAKPGDEASPIRLVYRSLRARVANRCGEWPADLASASSLEGWQNRPYWNYGCSYQNAFATQVADPRDFVAPRAEAPTDVEMRRRAIEKVRQGADPGSSWRTTNTNIGGVGG